MTEKTAFEENLRKRAETIRGEFEREVSDFVTNLVKNKYREIQLNYFPRMVVIGETGFAHREPRATAYFESNKETTLKFEDIALKRFESSLENLRWVFENQRQP